MDYPIEMVEWIDSNGLGGWNSLATALGYSNMNCHSVGFVVAETDAAILMSAHLDGQEGKSLGLHAPMWIPKVAITSRNVIRSEARP